MCVLVDEGRVGIQLNFNKAFGRILLCLIMTVFTQSVL